MALAFPVDVTIPDRREPLRRFLAEWMQLFDPDNASWPDIFGNAEREGYGEELKEFVGARLDGQRPSF